MLNQMILMLRMALLRLSVDKEGQDVIEYALLVALISIVTVVATGLAGTAVANLWVDVTNALSAF